MPRCRPSHARFLPLAGVDALFQAGIPLLAKIIDLGELGHA
jgi:hypothetical protein